MKQNKIWPVIRDVIIVQGLTVVGGFIQGFNESFAEARHGLNPSHSHNFYDDIFYLIVGFAISGCLATGNRWRHLAFVAVTFWVGDIFAVFFFGVTLSQWTAQAVGIVICIGIGGGISYLFKRKTNTDGKIDQTPNQLPTSGDTSANAGDDIFYEEVALELQEEPMLPGLWTKAYAEMEGDDAKTRALYIKYRVAQLAEARRQKHEEDRVEGQRKEEKQLTKTKTVEDSIKPNKETRLAVINVSERQSRTGIDRFNYTILAIVSGVLTLVSAIGGLLTFFLVLVPDSSQAVNKIGWKEISFIIFIALIFFLCSYFLGRATQHCLEKTK